VIVAELPDVHFVLGLSSFVSGAPKMLRPKAINEKIKNTSRATTIIKR
jgi:hypothetical protein